jgi:hypothetical protein
MGFPFKSDSFTIIELVGFIPIRMLEYVNTGMMERIFRDIYS